MGSIFNRSGTFIVVILVLLVVVVLLLPQIRQWFLKLRSEEVTISRPASGPGGLGATAPQELKIITVLGRDGIPAILEPEFLTAETGALQMVPTERVIGVSINGDHRAYSLNLLSRHEIVNDTVGGKPIAVTW